MTSEEVKAWLLCGLLEEDEDVKEVGSVVHESRKRSRPTKASVVKRRSFRVFAVVVLKVSDEIPLKQLLS